MLRPRLIPCLLVRGGGLVKTVRFSEAKYVGDPINAVRIFNEKSVDELLVLDIEATRQEREPNYKLIANLASECRMPLAYGGGVRTPEQVERIIGLGVEKVAMSSAIMSDPGLIARAASHVGSQSVVAIIDVKRSALLRRPEVVTHNATRHTGRDPVEVARELAARGAGEIVINSVDRDGTMDGYDFEVVARVREAVNTPLTVLGGAGSIDDIADLYRRFGIVGAAAGSLFVFKGKYRAVLISYPNRTEKAELIRMGNLSS